MSTNLINQLHCCFRQNTAVRLTAGPTLKTVILHSLQSNNKDTHTGVDEPHSLIKKTTTTLLHRRGQRLASHAL